MPRDIFGEVVDPTPGLGGRSWYTVPLSIVVHAALGAAVVIVPLMASDVMPSPRQMISAIMVEKPLPAAPPPPAAPQESSPAARPAAVSDDAAPIEAPDTIAPEASAPSIVLSNTPEVPGGLPGGVISGLGVVPGVPAPPAPAPVTQPLPVGGRIKPPAKLRHVPPVYPAMALQARVEGMVIIEAVIGIDGRVKQARVLLSKPLLDEAALTAVRQWVFSPTMLNGVPVPVVMTVTVNFTLR